MQSLVDRAPPAQQYYSDEFNTYGTLVYLPGRHEFMGDKSQTYSVEGANADLRHYLARLGRRSRCFSRCLEALRRAVKLFVHAWNRRQRYREQYPHYPAHLIDFIYP